MLVQLEAERRMDLGFSVTPTRSEAAAFLESSSSSSVGGASNNYIEHTVSKLDTLAGIAIKYGVKVSDIKQMNGLMTDLQMFAHKTLHIPLPGRHPPSANLSNNAKTPRCSIRDLPRGMPFLAPLATELEIEAYPILDELTSKISTMNLEHVRRLKRKLVALTRRVQKVRDEIEKLMDDDGDMDVMYLTKKKEHMEATYFRDHSLYGCNSVGVGFSVSAPLSPACSPPDSSKLERTISLVCSRHERMRDFENNDEHIQELEMLLEAFFMVIDSTLNKLTSLKEYIDDTEDFINIQLSDEPINVDRLLAWTDNQVGEDCRLLAEDIANSVQQIFNMIHATCIGYIKD